MLIVWALLLCIASNSDAASPRRSQSSRHFSAPHPHPHPRPPPSLLAGHAPQARLPHSHNSATRIGARSSTASRSLKGFGSPRGSPNVFTAASTKKKKKETHLFFLRLKPNKAVPAVSTTTPKPTEAPIFIIKSTPHPGEPPVFIVKPTAAPPPVPAPNPPASWPAHRPSSTKPGHHRPTMSRPRPPALPTPSSKPQSVHYHWHQHGPTPISPQGAHHIKYIVKTKTSYPRIRRPQPVRPPPQRIVIRPNPQPIKQPVQVHHTHQHLHHHLVPATQIIIRKRPQDPSPSPRRRPWNIF